MITGVLCTIAIVYAGLKTWSYCKRQYNGILNVGLVSWFLIYSISAIGNVLLFMTISICIHTFIFYKGQTVLHILLPTDNVESNLYTYTAIAFFFKVNFFHI